MTNDTVVPRFKFRCSRKLESLQLYCQASSTDILFHYGCFQIACSSKSIFNRKQRRSHLVDTGGQVERPEDDLPCQIYDIPQILVVHAKRDRVPPQCCDMLRLRHEYLRRVTTLRV